MLASDRPAKEIKSLEERLRTRFEWGLTADIQPPDFETRVAIIRRKAELFNLDMPDDVAEFIANHLKNNIRQLEGAVKKLNAYYMLEGIQPVIGVAQNAIKDILNETQPVPVTIEKIIGEVGRTYNVTPAEIRGMRRTANISSARQTAILCGARNHRHEHGGHRQGIRRPGSLHHRVLPEIHGEQSEQRPPPEGNGGGHHQKRPLLKAIRAGRPFRTSGTAWRTCRLYLFLAVAYLSFFISL